MDSNIKDICYNPRLHDLALSFVGMDSNIKEICYNPRLHDLALSFVDMDSNIKDICYNPRLHDLVLDIWPPCCATSFVVVVVGPTRP